VEDLLAAGYHLLAVQPVVDLEVFQMVAGHP
jgi:hypothetical protein